MATALLLIDLQSFFDSMISPRLITNVKELITLFHQKDFPVIVTQHGHPDSDFTAPATSSFPAPPLSNQLVRRWGTINSIHRFSKDWQLQVDIRAHLKALFGPLESAAALEVVQKTTYDAFLGTNLESLLARRSVTKLVIAGVMTDCCVDTTARSAFNRGYETSLVKDACGTSSKEQHTRGLEGFEFAFGEVLSASEVMKGVK